MSKTETVRTGSQARARLIVERADGEYWGRTKIKGNLIADSTANLQQLVKQMKKLALDFENVEVENFEIVYDLTAFFESHTILSISDLAKRAGINAALMRQYASGSKFPSEARVKEIEKAIREVGQHLSRIRLHRAERARA